MADGWTMGRTGWLVVLVLVSGFRRGLGAISVTTEKTVTGYKGESVVIPCTYTKSNEEIVKIEWEFKNQPVIYRTESEDHILLVSYRNRAVLSKSPAEDVSLTLKRLDVSDRGDFKCKVTGRDGSGNLITKEGITLLKVIRTRPVTEKPKVTTEEAKITTENIDTETLDMDYETTEWWDVNTNDIYTETPDMEAETAEWQDINTKDIYTETADMETGTTEWQNVNTKNIVTETPNMETETTAWRSVNTKNIVTETPVMKTETTAWRDVTTRTSITITPDVKVTSVGKEPDLITEIPVSGTDNLYKKIFPANYSPIVTGTSITITPDVKVTSVGKDLTPEKIVTEKPNMEITTTAWRDVNTKLLTTKPDVEVSRSGRKPDKTTGSSIAEDDSAIVTTKQPRRFHSSTIPVVPFTTIVMHNNPAADAIKGSGIFFYVLIIGLLCIISVVILAIVLIARRKKRKSYIYDLSTMNQLALNLEERSYGGGGCQSFVEPASNNYEPCFPVSQYESLPICSNEYEPFLIKNPEGNDIHCEPSEQCAQPV